MISLSVKCPNIMTMLQVANSLTARSLPKVVRRDLTQDINTEHHNKVHL